MADITLIAGVVVVVVVVVVDVVVVLVVIVVVVVGIVLVVEVLVVVIVDSFIVVVVLVGAAIAVVPRASSTPCWRGHGVVGSTRRCYHEKMFKYVSCALEPKYIQIVHMPNIPSKQKMEDNDC